MTEIPQEIRDRVRRRYGNIVDIIYLRNILQPNEKSEQPTHKFEIGLNPKKLLKIRDMGNQISNELMVESSMIELCQYIEKTFFDRKPNCGLSENYSACVTDNIPEGVIYMHPKTYDGLCRKIRNL